LEFILGARVAKLDVKWHFVPVLTGIAHAIIRELQTNRRPCDA
jgi:hypothetical protein